MNAREWRPDTTLRAKQTVLDTEVSGERVLLDPDSGMYYGLNRLGAQLWGWLQEPCAVAELRDRIATEFEVPAERAGRDLDRFLTDLAAKGLVETDVETDA